MKINKVFLLFVAILFLTVSVRADVLTDRWYYNSNNVYFDNSYNLTPNLLNDTTGGTFTVSMNVYDLSPIATDALFDSNGAGGRSYMRIQNLQFLYYDGSVFNKFNSFRLNEEKWHHITFVANGTTNSLYVNGSLYASNTSISRNLGIGGYMQIGSNYAASSDKFWGNMTDIAIWNRALGESDVSEWYALTCIECAVGSTTLQIRAYDQVNGSQIMNFNVTIQKQGTTVEYSNVSTTGIAYIIDPQQGTYTVNVSAIGYAHSSTTKVILANITNKLDVYMDRYNSLNVTIYDENTGNIINDSNTTISFFYGDSNFDVVTTDGTYYIDNLTVDTYTLTFTNTNYTTRSYIVTVNNNTAYDLNAYLIPTGGETVTFTIQDYDDGSNLEGATISISRYIDGDLTVVDVLTSDITGRAEFTYNDGVLYKFDISADNYQTKSFQLNPIIFTSYTVRLRKTVSYEDTSDYSGINIIHYPNEFLNNYLNKVNFTFISPSGSFSEYGFNVTFENVSYETSGTNAYGGFLNYTLNITNASFLSYVYVTWFYKSEDGLRHPYSASYLVGNTDPNKNTFADLRENKYNLPIFDRIVIVVFITILITAIAEWFGGKTASPLVALLTLGFFGYTAFIPYWAVMVPVIAIISVVTWRESS